MSACWYKHHLLHLVPRSVGILGKDHSWDGRGRGHGNKAIAGTRGVRAPRSHLGRGGGACVPLTPPLHHPGQSSALGSPPFPTRVNRHSGKTLLLGSGHTRCAACTAQAPGLGGSRRAHTASSQGPAQRGARPTSAVAGPPPSPPHPTPSPLFCPHSRLPNTVCPSPCLPPRSPA